MPASFESVVDAVRASGGPVLLATRDQAARGLARSVRLTLGAERVGVLHAPAPITAWTLMLHGLASVPAERVSCAGGAAAALLGVIRTRLVLSSVSTLDKPAAPSLGQRLASLWPTSRFSLDLQTGTVSRFDGQLPLDGIAPIAARSARPVVGGQTAGWPLDPRLVLDLGEVEAGWRARRWLEISTLTYPPEQVVGHVLAQAGTRQCPACHRPTTSDTCLFCEIPVPELVPHQQGAPA